MADRGSRNGARGCFRITISWHPGGTAAAIVALPYRSSTFMVAFLVQQQSEIIAQRR
jgi:hypothetical protein